MNNDILEKQILHGRDICYNTLLYYDYNLPEVFVSNDIEILTVIDNPSLTNASLVKSNITNNNINIVLVEKYIKWISKIEGVLNYINDNYNNLPDYILYLDGTDTLVINDILNPKELLEYYNCKILFNSEPDYWHTGAESPKDYPNFYNELYRKPKTEYVTKSKKKYGLKKWTHHSLNAGVFLGEKDYVKKLMEETLDLMEDDYHKGFPYGAMDDQCILKYLHNKYFEDISIDLFHKSMFWGYGDSLKNEINRASPNLLEEERIKYEKNKKS